MTLHPKSSLQGEMLSFTKIPKATGVCFLAKISDNWPIFFFFFLTGLFLKSQPIIFERHSTHRQGGDEQKSNETSIRFLFFNQARIYPTK